MVKATGAATNEEELTMKNTANSVNNVLPLVLKVPEVAAVLGIGVGRCYELARCGKLRSIKLGKRILIPRAAIFEFLGMAEETPA